jgi:hypothetical protein
MIQTPTTLVIGAGAGKPYGLPTGKELCASARALAPDTPIFQLLLQCSVPSDDLAAVLVDLRRYQAPTIDEFLESRQHEPVTMCVGRLLIAALMGDALAKARSTVGGERSGGDWLWYVIDKMRSGSRSWPEFARGNAELRFVTLNFDSTLEDRMSRAIRQIHPQLTYDPFSSEAAIKLQPVVHLHGVLPRIPSVPLKGNGIDAFDAQWIEWTKDAARQVNVVRRSIDPEVQSRARDHMKRAAVLCFLGFGYASENMTRLSLHEVFGPGSDRREAYGSAFGLDRGEQEKVCSTCDGQIMLGDFNDSCLNVLQSFHILRD